MCSVQTYRELEHLTMVKIGDCFLARGVINEYFEQTQIKCAALKIVKDPDFETLWINKVLLEKKNRESSKCLLKF